MLGKITDGILAYPPNRIVLSGIQIFNPTDEQLMQVGYKTITETPMPEDPAPEGQHYEAQYTDSGDTITQSWVLVDNSLEDTAKTLEQRVTDLENNQNDMNRVFEEVVNSESGIL